MAFLNPCNKDLTSFGSVRLAIPKLQSPGIFDLKYRYRVVRFLGRAARRTYPYPLYLASTASNDGCRHIKPNNGSDVDSRLKYLATEARIFQKIDHSLK